MCIFVQLRSELVKSIQENRFNIKKKELCESLKKLNTILCMDVQCFPVNFCTDFPLKVKYSDFHKIYITIPKQSLDIYILHLSVTCSHVSPIFVCIRYLHLPVRSIFQICTFPRYVIRVINNPEWITILISRKLPQYGSVRCLKLHN